MSARTRTVARVSAATHLAVEALQKLRQAKAEHRAAERRPWWPASERQHAANRLHVAKQVFSYRVRGGVS